MKSLSTDQEKFWAGEFGDAYAARNTGEQFIANQVAYFSKIFNRTNSVKSVMEFGANIGENLKAIKKLMPSVKLSAVEINKSAAKEIKNWSEGKVKVHNKSLLDFIPTSQFDFVFVKGVLIHINPEKLPIAYGLLYETSSKYINIGEYYNPSPTGIDYRGHKDRLFKRDFCGEIMKKYPDLKLIDYGFSYHLDPNFPQDNITWFLLEKE